MDKKIRLFIAGISSIITLFPAAPSFGAKPPIMNDREALADDWQRVGADLRDAMSQDVEQATH